MHRLTVLFKKSKKHYSFYKNSNVILLVCDDTVVDRNSFTKWIDQKKGQLVCDNKYLESLNGWTFFLCFFSYIFKDLLMAVKNVRLFPTKSCFCFDYLLTLVLFRFMNGQGDMGTNKVQFQQIVTAPKYNIIFFCKLDYFVLVVGKKSSSFFELMLRLASP